MSRYLTVAEIAKLWTKPEGTVRWLAHRDKWQRSTDRRRPVLYLTTDVEDTMKPKLDNRGDHQRS